MKPYDFFQYWRNVEDADVINCMKWLTFVPIEEIESYEKLEGSQLNPIKEKLAFELTKMVHGEDEANKVLAAAKQIFMNGGISEDMPTTVLTDEDFQNDEIGILTMLVKGGLCPSNAEARRNVQGNGISVNDEKVADPKTAYSKADFADGLIVKKGKKVYHKFIVE